MFRLPLFLLVLVPLPALAHQTDRDAVCRAVVETMREQSAANEKIGNAAAILGLEELSSAGAEGRDLIFSEAIESQKRITRLAKELRELCN